MKTNAYLLVFIGTFYVLAMVSACSPIRVISNDFNPEAASRNYHWESEEVVIDEYREGTVTIDLIDAETNEMVGQSVASGTIVGNDEKLQKRIDEGMAKSFDKLWARGK